MAPNWNLLHQIQNMKSLHNIEPTGEKAIEIDQVLQRIISKSAEMQSKDMNVNIMIRPSYFFSSVVVEARCEQNTHAIVHLTNKSGKIVKMFGWYLLNGANITTINDLEPGELSELLMVISDGDGKILYESPLVAA